MSKEGKIERLTQAQAEQLIEQRDRWVSVGLSTEPSDRATAEECIAEHYRWSGLKRPRFLWFDSPIGCVVARSIMGGQVRNQVWDQVRDQVEDQVEDQVWVQVVDQVVDQIRAQVRDQVKEQTR